jgi:prepilin-type N-terminal cleavage/methylation domain-containing protein
MVRSRGFTLIEVLMVIALMSILAFATLDVTTDTLNESRFQATVAQLQQIQNAMIGDPTVMENNVRTSFGFLGDIGAIPTASQGILALVSQPSPVLPTFAINSTVRFGIGWNGPYLNGANSGTNYTKDAWGNALIYSPAANPPTIVSLGSDGAVGGTGYAQDLTYTLSTQLTTATVQGFICNHGAPFTSAAQVELNYPNGLGVLTQAEVTLTAANAGQFSFSGVPLGVRSITVYQPSKASATSTLGPVVITVDKPNYLVACNAIDINP